jgi:hypothetical protein
MNHSFDFVYRYILNDIFSSHTSSDIITISTKSALLELEEQALNSLHGLLSDTLDFILKNKTFTRYKGRAQGLRSFR